jgi:hypothetical protein
VSADTFGNATSKDKGHGNSQSEEPTGGKDNAVVIGGGKCTGLRCKKRPNPPRFAKGCSHKYCQNCCHDAQLANQELSCTLSSHCRARSNAKAPSATKSQSSSNPVASGGSKADLPESIGNRDDFYDATKPLTKAHYEVRNRAQEDYQEGVKALEQVEKQEKLMEKHIMLLFWKEVRTCRSLPSLYTRS